MPQPSVLIGNYLGLAQFKVAINSVAPNRDAIMLRHISAACRAFEGATRRVFFPYTATNLYRWPPFQVGATWSLWFDQDLLAVDSLLVAASGTSPIAIAPTDYFLEPQQFGPPYNCVEINLSTQSAFQSGPTPQRSVSVAGQWGYCNTTIAAGTITGLSGSVTTTSATVSDARLVEPGDLLLIDSEQAYVAGMLGAALTLQRGVNGTAAASHPDATAASKYTAPADVVTAITADAAASYQQEMASWGRILDQQIGAPEYHMVMNQQKRYVSEIASRYRRERMGAI